MLCHFSVYLFPFVWWFCFFFLIFLSFHGLFDPYYSASPRILGGEELSQTLTLSSHEQGLPFSCLALAEGFQKEIAFSENKAKGAFLVTCPNLVLITSNGSTLAVRAQRLQQGPELQSQRKSRAGDRAIPFKRQTCALCPRHPSF